MQKTKYSELSEEEKRDFIARLVDTLHKDDEVFDVVNALIPKHIVFMPRTTPKRLVTPTGLITT